MDGLLKPARYPSDTLHAASPLLYYSESLQTSLLVKVMRLGADKHGKIDFDVAGTLSGNWFLEGLPVGESAGPSAWDKHLAFVPDVYDATIRRVSIGGQLAKVGAFAAHPNDPIPSQVTSASGKVAYHLYNRGGLMEQPGFSSQEGLVIVQMLGAERIRIEAFNDPVNLDAEFTTAARIYVR